MHAFKSQVPGVTIELKSKSMHVNFIILWGKIIGMIFPQMISHFSFMFKEKLTQKTLNVRKCYV